MDRNQVAQEMNTRLQLETLPIALAFVQTVPEDIPMLEQAVPSACSLWRKAETGVFYAPAESHFNCPIGAMTMGFELSANLQEQLMGLVENMCACAYITPDEPPQIPSVKKKYAG